MKEILRVNIIPRKDKNQGLIMRFHKPVCFFCLICNVILLLNSCSLITEPDISGSEVYLIAPYDCLRTTTATHTFWWDYVSDAEKYNLIIVSPSWDSVISLVVDTNVSGNKFYYTLNPGDYDWAVSAYNYSSATDYSINHLTIDTTSSLYNQVVVLNLPVNNTSTNDESVLFSWYKISSADSYIFDIRYTDWQGSSVFPSKNTSYDTVKYQIEEEGVYAWGVQARNDFSNTLFTTRTLIIDRTPPGQSSFVQPAYSGDTIQGDNKVLSWTRPGESLSTVSDSLFIATDSLFTPSKIKDIVVTDQTEFSMSDYSSGFYFCKLRSFDAAGNMANISEPVKFYIDEE